MSPSAGAAPLAMAGRKLLRASWRDPQHREAVGAVGVPFVLRQLEGMPGGEPAHRARAFEQLVVQLQRLQHQLAVRVGRAVAGSVPTGDAFSAAVVDGHGRQFAGVQG